MRLFTAIDIPEEVRRNLKTLLDRLRPSARISWSPAENLHITTKFIGEWPESRLEEIQRALAVVRAPGPMEISIRGLGWFPNARHPRVFWCGVESGSELAALARSTEDAVAALDIPKEDRAFSPHLTLARIRESIPLDPLRQAIEGLPSTDFGSFSPAAFFLYLSRGGKYTKLAEFGLA